MNRTVNLQYPGCIDDGRIMHELLHTLGIILSHLHFSAIDIENNLFIDRNNFYL